MRLAKHPRTDARYSVLNHAEEEIGTVSKCWTGRSSFWWVIEPAGYAEQYQVSTLRVGYKRRGEAVEALFAFHNAIRDDDWIRRSLVEG